MRYRVQPVISIILFLILVLQGFHYVWAGPTNGTYEVVEYGFGAGGTEGSGNGTYSVNGIAGEINGDTASNGTYSVGSGLVFTQMANVPPAPTFTNPGNSYDRLQFILNTGGNPSDTEYAIAISSDDFVTTFYVQNDNTIGTVLGSEDWQTYANWGSGTGEYATGLNQNTTYKIRVKARQGGYTESGYGPTASATTQVPTLTFGVSANTITFNNLNSGNSYTDSSKSTTLTTSTNAYSGYTVYGRVTSPLTSGATTISNYASSNASPTVWSGTGFGYSTNDSNLTGGTADRFTNGGPKYAGFSLSSPGDPVADTPGPILSPIVNEQFTVSYRLTAPNTQTAGTYTTTILYVVVPTF